MIEERTRLLEDELGVTACSGEIPDDQAEDAGAVVEELSTSTDPVRVCDEIVYDAYLETSFPTAEDNYESCARFQEKLVEKDSSATGIEVTEVKGTEGSGQP